MMKTKNLTMPEDALVTMLKTLPRHALVDVFWKTFVENDISPLDDKEREEIKRAESEVEKGETVKWEDLMIEKYLFLCKE